jgi:hypothetical protein
VKRFALEGANHVYPRTATTSLAHSRNTANMKSRIESALKRHTEPEAKAMGIASVEDRLTIG